MNQTILQSVFDSSYLIFIVEQNNNKQINNKYLAAKFKGK